jgi:hypothetical protein
MSSHTQMPERKDGRVDMLRHFPTLLTRWRGSHAQMTELTESHRTLRGDRERGRSGFQESTCLRVQDESNGVVGALKYRPDCFETQRREAAKAQRGGE